MLNKNQTKVSRQEQNNFVGDVKYYTHSTSSWFESHIPSHKWDPQHSGVLLWCSYVILLVVSFYFDNVDFNLQNFIEVTYIFYVKLM